MSKQLLIETRMNSLVLNESKSRQVHPGCLGTLDGPCADLKKATRNGNFYSRKLWENVFKDPIVKESLEDRILIGELDHPGDRLETKAVNAAIVMTDYEFRDDEGLLYGTFDILDTPNGRILKSLLDYGCKIGVSSRGEGDVTADDNGVDVVDEESYSFMGFDAVVLPAVKAAKPSLRESLDRKSATLKESLMKQVQESTTIAELNLIKSVVEAADLPDSDSLMESVSNKAQELIEGTTGSSNLLEDLEEATRQIKSQSEEIRKLKEELTTCKSRVCKLMRSRQKIVDQLRSQKNESEELRAELGCSRFESFGEDRKVEQLQEELSRSEEQVKSLRKQVRSASYRTSRLESQVESLEKSLRESQEFSSDKVKEVKGLSEEIERLKSSASSKLTESRERGRSLKDSLSKTKSELRESVQRNSDFIKSYVEDTCKSYGISPSTVLESVKPGMSKKQIDQLMESVRDRSDRYKSLSFTDDKVLGALDTASVKINGGQVREDPEISDTVDFMNAVNKLL